MFATVVVELHVHNMLSLIRRNTEMQTHQLTDKHIMTHPVVWSHNSKSFRDPLMCCLARFTHVWVAYCHLAQNTDKQPQTKETK